MADKKYGDLHEKKEVKARAELAYEWVAKYKDGTELKQYDDTLLRAHHFGHIDQEKITEFILVATREPQIGKLSVNLETGLFSLNGRVMSHIRDGQSQIPLGLFIGNRSVTSSWGNKAKLIFLKHVRRDFHMGTGTTTVTILYEFGWEADVDGKHEKHTIIVDSHGRLAIPPDDFAGFEAL